MKKQITRKWTSRIIVPLVAVAIVALAFVLIGSMQSFAVGGENDNNNSTEAIATDSTDADNVKEAYGVLDSNNTLSLYYDDQKDSRQGTKYSIPTNAKHASDWQWDSIRSSIKNVDVDISFKDFKDMKSTASMFSGFNNCDAIQGAENIDMSNVTNMSNMFSAFGWDSRNLNQVPNVANWDTEKVTNMSSVFLGYGNNSVVLDEVPDVSKWDTSNAVEINSIFRQYGFNSVALSKVPDVSMWKTSNVTDMSAMFTCYGFYSETLNEVPSVSDWDTSNVANMNDMFNNYGYANGKSPLNKVPDVGKWDTSNVTNMKGMFSKYGGNALAQVPDVSVWNTSNVTDMNNMFGGYGSESNNLSKVPDVSKWNTTMVSDMCSMFNDYGSKSITLDSLDLRTWDIANLKFVEAMFNGYGESCTTTPIVYSTDWSSKKTLIAPSMFTSSKLKGSGDTWESANTSVTGRFTDSSEKTAERLEGSDRLDTMLEIVKKESENTKGKPVVLATDGDFPDALAASGLAGVEGGSIVLTPKDNLASQTKGALDILQPSKVYIAGGTGVVSTEVENEIKALGYTTERCAGAGRVETAEQVYYAAKGSWGDTCIVATSANFADALAVSPLAYAKKYPILLANGDKELNTSTADLIKSAGFKNMIIVGGTGVVSNKVIDQTEIETVTRLSGANRIETANKIVAYELSHGMTCKCMSVATAANYPDALSGSSLCGSNNSVLCLIDANDASTAKATIAQNKSFIEHLYILGGTGAVTSKAESQINSYLK